MSILGAVVRVRPQHLEVVVPRMSALPGLDLALNPGDGRLVLVLEDAEREGQVHSAAATLAAIAMWPEVLDTSLVYEYSGPDAPPAGSGAVEDYRAWRGSLKDWAGEGAPPGKS